jgi:hypothetical protein
MRATRTRLISLLLLALPLAAFADSDKHGHGKHEYKEEYWDGHCKVERKIKKNGEVKEKRKCKGDEHAHYHAEPVYVPAPAPVIMQPGVTVQGTIRIP